MEMGSVRWASAYAQLSALGRYHLLIARLCGSHNFLLATAHFRFLLGVSVPSEVG